MQALTLLRIQAHANRLANLRLHTAMAPLSQADLDAPRTAFFPTLMATLYNAASRSPLTAARNARACSGLKGCTSWRSTFGVSRHRAVRPVPVRLVP